MSERRRPNNIDREDPRDYPSDRHIEPQSGRMLQDLDNGPLDRIGDVPTACLQMHHLPTRQPCEEEVDTNGHVPVRKPQVIQSLHRVRSTEAIMDHVDDYPTIAHEAHLPPILATRHRPSEQKKAVLFTGPPTYYQPDYEAPANSPACVTSGPSQRINPSPEKFRQQAQQEEASHRGRLNAPLPPTPTLVPRKPVSQAPTPTLIPRKPVTRPPTPTVISRKPVSQPPTPTLIPRKPVARPPTPTVVSRKPVSQPPTPTLIPRKPVASGLSVASTTATFHQPTPTTSDHFRRKPVPLDVPASLKCRVPLGVLSPNLPTPRASGATNRQLTPTVSFPLRRNLVSSQAAAPEYRDLYRQMEERMAAEEDIWNEASDICEASEAMGGPDHVNAADEMFPRRAGPMSLDDEEALLERDHSESKEEKTWIEAANICEASPDLPPDAQGKRPPTPLTIPPSSSQTSRPPARKSPFASRPGQSLSTALDFLQQAVRSEDLLPRSTTRTLSTNPPYPALASTVSMSRHTAGPPSRTPFGTLGRSLTDVLAMSQRVVSPTDFPGPKSSAAPSVASYGPANSTDIAPSTTPAGEDEFRNLNHRMTLMALEGQMPFTELDEEGLDEWLETDEGKACLRRHPRGYDPRKA